MRQTKFFFTCLFMFFFHTAFFAIENTILYFGPKTENAIVFTASLGTNNTETSAVKQLYTLSQQFEKTPPSLSVIIAITANDRSPLPDFVPVNTLEGTKSLIRIIARYKNPAVILLDTGTVRPQIESGANGIVCPPWLFQSVYTQLVRSSIVPRYKDFDTILRRLHWLIDDPRLQLYTENNIPAIKIKTEASIVSALISLPETIKDTLANDRDKHYLTLSFGKHCVIFPEKHLIILIAIVIAVFLFIFIMFSFLSEHKHDRHIKDLIRTSYLPLYYFLANMLCFFIALKYTELLFYFQFGAKSGIEALPALSFFVYFSSALLLIAMNVFVHNIIPMPSSTFMYGYIGSSLSLINIFIFSALNFSLSIIFLAFYLISFISYRNIRIPIQAVCFLLMLSMFFPFITSAFQNSTVIWKRMVFHSVFFSFALIPLNLFGIRLFFNLYPIAIRKKRLLFRIYLALIGAAVLVSSTFVFIFSHRLKANHENTIICQTLENGVLTTELKTSIPLSEKTFQPMTISDDINHFVSVSISSHNYLERRISTVTVASLLPTEAVELNIYSEDGLAVYEADRAFTRSDKGETARFISVAAPSMPFVVQFSGDKDITKIRVSVSLWTKADPFQTKKMRDSILQNAPYLLKIVKTEDAVLIKEPT
ncbi:hypothetical protein DWQ65_05185 [Treponema phagedenis]|uniref:Uncharacterized protein n=2 Tax=Treponema phagedenis TaxID=162 RepID=A0AAE6M946_TREPH|nr:hypothetical protein [Treponema phagedenis]NVP23470.1 hypothetical protein [Treponema phagedenis]QEJ95236.1 hypothetical protein FUT79_08495 [Treponema phagedenis]QEJ98612.1 hypothetical protein FUT82_11795 [Treponema phagedenis]QEK01090.1 hypothetical protein FUT84_07960 [Treponema phagedenis]QEK04119.1 hypothetical protein FUT83_10100 [Treponema phagedenis]